MEFKRSWMAAVATLSVVGAAAFAEMKSPLHTERTPAVADGLRLQVDLSSRQLAVIENGETTATYSVAIGTPSYPTPKGSFTIRRIIWNPRWVPPDSPWARKKRPKEPGEEGNPMGKVKIFFQEPDYYIHGTREVDSLGQAESHGCLRMRNADVIELAARVMAAGGKPVDQSWIHRVVNRIRSTREVRLSTGVPISISG
jgi:lipoprotein-anchoring transpeptidase ErfK/SrfK